MKLVIGNTKTRCIVDAQDYLLDDPLNHLNDYLAIKVKGAHFSPAYKKRQWDGYRRFLTPAGYFATGFLPLVVNFLEDIGVKLRVEDNRKNLPVLNDELDDYVGRIDGEDWVARDYQLEAVKKLRNYVTIAGEKHYFPRGIMDLATNAGKNSLSALIYRNVPKGTRILFTVSNRGIYKQAVEFFADVISEEIGEVRSGKVNLQNFTVCMAKTMLNRSKDSINVKAWLNSVEVLIVDESDEAGANQYSKLLATVGAGMRVFVSGTPLDADPINNMIAVGLSGTVLSKITNKYLIDHGYSQKPRVTILRSPERSTKKLSYEQEKYQFIHTSEKRAQVIVDVIKANLDKSILITFNDIAHGNFMYDYITARLDLDIGIVHGTSEDREDILEMFKSGRLSVLLGSMILKKGLNIPVIELIIMAHGGKSKIVLKQFVGRGVRTDGKNTEMDIYDFYDAGKYLSDHSRRRIRMYRAEEFEVITKYREHRGKPID